MEIPVLSEPRLQESWDDYLVNTLQDPTLSDAQKFDLLWAAYQFNKSSDSRASLALDLISQLRKLPDAAPLITELEDAMTSAELKAHLLAALEASLLDPDGRASARPDRDRILKAIYRQTSDADTDIASDAIQIYARHGSPTAAIAILNNAYQHQRISPADFIRELAFKVPGASGADEQAMLVTNLIDTAHAHDSAEVSDAMIGAVAVINASSDDGLKLDPTRQTQLLNYFRQHEPQFASDPAQFGMTMAVSYYNWLNGFASLASNGNRDAADHIMLQSILDPMTDSRKVTAMLMSDSGPRLTALAHQEGNVQLMESKLQSALAGLRPGSGAYAAHLSMLNQLAQSSR